MDQSYEEIYRAAELRTDIGYVLRLCQIGNPELLEKEWNSKVGKIIELCHRYAETDTAAAQALADAASEVARNLTDMCFAQSLINNKLLVCIDGYLSQYDSIDVPVGKWTIKGTASGYVTMIDAENGKYVHSAYDPMEEARILADRLYDPGMSDFYVFGCGLGYLAYQLWKRSMGSMHIHVYESSEAITLAGLFGPLDLIPDDRIEIQAETDIERLICSYAEAAAQNRGFDNIYVSPSLCKVIIERYPDNPALCIPADITHLSAKRNWEINVRCNRKNALGYYRDFDNNAYRDEWVVVAAGPSLDDNVEFIRNSLGVRTVIAVNRCIPKLAELDIRPDMYIVVDPYEAIFDHIKGYEVYTAGIPLLADDCSYWGFVEAYQGPKYLINTFYNKGSDYLNDLDLPKWNTGGTVASAAIESACLMGAKKIYVIGVDLAYPSGIRYAMSDEKIDETAGYLSVRSNDGQNVYTSASFQGFANQIQEQTQRHKDVQMFNLSKHGMYISGMHTGKWWEKGLDEITDPSQWLNDLYDDDFLSWDEKYYLLRQMVDRPGFSGDETVRSSAERVLDQICEKLLSEFPGLREIKIKTGSNLNVILTSSTEDLKEEPEISVIKKYMGSANTLIINTQEKLSGKEVCLEDRLDKTPSGISDDADTINLMGRKISYYQIPEPVPNIDFYTEVLSFISGQKGVKIESTDPYSLFGTLCKRLLKV